MTRFLPKHGDSEALQLRVCPAAAAARWHWIPDQADQGKSCRVADPRTVQLSVPPLKPKPGRGVLRRLSSLLWRPAEVAEARFPIGGRFANRVSGGGGGDVIMIAVMAVVVAMVVVGPVQEPCRKPGALRVPNMALLSMKDSCNQYPKPHTRMCLKNLLLEGHGHQVPVHEPQGEDRVEGLPQCNLTTIRSYAYSCSSKPRTTPEPESATSCLPA